MVNIHLVPRGDMISVVDTVKSPSGTILRVVVGPGEAYVVVVVVAVAHSVDLLTGIDALVLRNNLVALFDSGDEYAVIFRSFVASLDCNDSNFATERFDDLSGDFAGDSGANRCVNRRRGGENAILSLAVSLRRAGLLTGV